MEDKIFDNSLVKIDPSGQSQPEHTNHLAKNAVSGYYRSKMFSATNGPNQLIDAAAPLFSIASRLNKINAPKNRDKFLSDLVHEVKAFENKAQIFRYHSNIILAARYALCALLDETIMNTDWGPAFNWNQENLLLTFHHEADGDERFFVILHRAFEDPAIHLDLLELIYLALSLGFTGKYGKKESDLHELTFITNNLYNCIRQHRGEVSKSLNVTATSFDHLPQAEVPNTISWWLIIALILLVNSLVFIGLDWHLRFVSNQLLDGHELTN
jgi:type VI secretion system protein ImpK